nr:MAG TPA: hypothetical protein [Caudoviricetes sp.]
MSKVFLRPFSGQPDFKVCLCQHSDNGNESCCCAGGVRIISG